VIVILGVIKPCTYTYTRILRDLITRSCAYLDSLGNLAYRPKSGFKNKLRAGFGLQIKANLQLWLDPPFEHDQSTYFEM